MEELDKKDTVYYYVRGEQELDNIDLSKVRCGIGNNPFSHFNNDWVYFKLMNRIKKQIKKGEK